MRKPYIFGAVFFLAWMGSQLVAHARCTPPQQNDRRDLCPNSSFIQICNGQVTCVFDSALEICPETPPDPEPTPDDDTDGNADSEPNPTGDTQTEETSETDGDQT